MIRLFSVIALLVLSVSVSSVFVESAYADEADAIQVILGMTYGNIQESFVDAGINPEEDPVFVAAQEDYFEALTALEAGDLDAAEENALSAMKLFEISAENIGELLEVQEATLQPPGLGTAVASIFNVQEGITNSDNESDELRELIKLNNFDDIDFTEYDESVNLAKTLLADGIVPDAQAQLVLANQIKDNLYAEIQAAAVENSKESIEEFLDEQENLGLTKKDIRELEEILEDITEEVDAPGQNNEDAPGNSGDAPGQNKDGELPPGFGAAGENPSENGLANGIGLGLGGDNLPPGQLKKFDDYTSSFEQSPDDYYENDFEAAVNDIFETNYDGTNKGNGKGLFGAFPGKSGEAPGQNKDKSNQDNDGSGNNNTTICHLPAGPAITLNVNANALAAHLAHNDTIGACVEGDPDGITDTVGNESTSIGVLYTAQGFTAIKNGVDDTASIRLDVVAPNGTSIVNNQLQSSGVTFRPDTDGAWVITAIDSPLTPVNRILTVDPTAGFTSTAGLDQLLVPVNVAVNLSGSGTGSAAPNLSYEWVIEKVSGPGGTPSLTDPGDGTASFTPNNGNSNAEFLLTLIVRDTGNYGYAADTLTVTVEP